MPRKDVISNDNIRAGDVVVGLASYGQATYEDSYSALGTRPPQAA
jgi:phosphoribosylformylglycinamidine cyclo-ligase